jgi:enolase
MVIPEEKSFKDSLAAGVKIYQELKRIALAEYGKRVLSLGDEGGIAPPIRKPEQALSLVSKAIKGKDAEIIIDVAASEFFGKGNYSLNGIKLDSSHLADYYLKLVRKHPVIGLEDPFEQDDFAGWQKLVSAGGLKMVIGDDLTVTNKERIKMAQKKKLCNAMIIKFNQIGTVTETIEAVKLAKSFGWKVIVSHRSGETKDDFIADLAVGVGADFIKSGAPGPIERMAKYDRLVKIEKEIK